LYFYILIPSCIRAAEINSAAFSNKVNSATFEENLGQIKYPDNKPAPEVKFVIKQGNLKIFLLKNGLAYQLEKYLTPTLSKGEGEDESLFSNNTLHNTTPKRLETYRMDMELVGANPNSEIIAEGKSQDYTNYYQPDLIQTHSYQKVIYKNIYPGIDWVIYIEPKEESIKSKASENFQPSALNFGLKYDFIVHPGANPALIRLKYKNAEQIYLDQFGNLILRNRLGDIRENAPEVFQNQEKLAANYILKDSIIHFQIDKYDKTQILIIDPQLDWSTYYGGTNLEFGYCNLDNIGNIYLYGTTSSNTNISYNGFQNNFTNGTHMFLAKFNPKGKRLWGTYYGAQSSSRAGAMYSDGSILIAGAATDSSSNYTHLGFQNTYGGGSQDGFIVKFDSSGLRIWASFYGGSGADAISDIKIDTNNDIYIAGTTTSPNAIAQSAYQDTLYIKYHPTTGSQIANNFIARLNANGTRAWSSYFGLNGYSPSIAIQGSELIFSNTYIDTHLLFTNYSNIYLTGTPLFMAKFSKLNGTRLLSKSIGLNLTSFSTFNYQGMFLNKNSIYALCGIATAFAPTLTTGFKKTPTGGSEPLILRIDTNLNNIWSSYLGGNSTDQLTGMAFDKHDNYYISGVTFSTSGIHFRGLKSTLPGTNSSFVYKISAKDSLIWSSYIGGNNITNLVSIIADKSDNIYLSGNTSSTSGLAYQGLQNTFSGGAFDACLMKISCAKLDTIRQSICIGDSVFFRAKYYKQIGFYTDSLLTWDICDSLTTIQLTALRKDTTYLYDTICSGTSYVWNGTNRTMSGIYRDTLVNNVGCDSFLVLNLLVKRTDTIQVYDTSCANLPKTFNGQNLTLAGVYRDTFMNAVGCDSHIFYHFIPKPIYETPLSRAICANDSTLFGDKYYKLAGVYYDTLKTIRNCDSVLKLTLTINLLDTNRQTQSICRGKSYNFYSQILTNAGTYSHKWTNRNGCDSTILLTLSVIDSSTYSYSRMLCSGQSFPFNNQNLTQAGVYRDTFMNYLGCDSFVTLNLSFGLVLYDTLRQTVCAGQVFRGYSSPGTYNETYKSNQGCDSILTIYLNHLPATEYKTIQHSKCGAFRYGSSTYTQNDSFTETIKNYLNCDSIVTKHLVSITEPAPSFLADKMIDFCEEIMHRGQRKTNSFFTHDTIKSLEYPYCDSLYQPYYYRRESRPILSPITKQIDTVIKGETTNIQVSGAQNYRWSTGEQSPSIRPQINEDKTFEVTTWNLADCEEKMQFSIYVIDQPLIDFPTAFSPNGDGLNDYFTPDTNGNITIDYFQIYNRWGEKVYEHSSLSKGWDGSYLGKPAANGLYTYTLRYSYLGRYFTRSGEVMMMR
jgi:gliding motility-associated-like protein